MKFLYLAPAVVKAAITCPADIPCSIPIDPLTVTLGSTETFTYGDIAAEYPTPLVSLNDYTLFTEKVS